MRRDARILVATLMVGGLWMGAQRAWVALAATATFRVRDVEISGLRYLDRDAVLHALGITEESNVWSDTGAWAHDVAQLPLVERARVRRRMPGTLVVSVVERTPVALVPTPVLKPVDARGALLPIDPAEHRLDLPVLHESRMPPRGSLFLPRKGRLLAAEIARLDEADAGFMDGASEVTWQGSHTLVIRWGVPEVDFLLDAEAPAQRVREGLAVLRDALARDPSNPPIAIDLRYADQVVVRRKR
jgi:cell division septal protein FtsQ